MKRSAMSLASVATTVAAAMLALSAFNPSVAQTSEIDVWSEYGAPVVEDNFPDSASVDGLLLDLPVDYFSEVTFPPMGDFGTDEQPMLMAGLDPTETP